MKLSIRTKLFIGISALLLFFILLTVGLTSFGLEKFYLWQKKDVLISTSRAIDDLYQGSPEEIGLELEKITNTLGAGLAILSKDGQVKYSSFGRVFNQRLLERLPPPRFAPHPNDGEQTGFASFRLRMPMGVLKTREVIDSRTVIEMQQERDVRLGLMALYRQLSNGDILILRQPLAPVSESAVAAAHFIAFTGLLSIFAGSLWAFVFAKKFTSPVLELNQVAQSMARLDFTKKCTINRSDEIGELGKSINHLSDQLDGAIAELHRKNQQLLADVEKERQLDKMRKDFVSSVSHELKTPLSLILGYAEGLKENVAGDEESRNYYCSVIIDEAEKMDKLVRDLLNLSQIESGYFQLSRSDFDLSLFLHEIALKYQGVLKEREIIFSLETTGKNLCVNGDTLRMEQVLTNLLNNAIDHAEFSKVVKIYTEDKGNKVRVFVYNSGRPIPEESLEKLWTSFYKVDKARTRAYGGYGLGLSIVRAIQDLHGNSYGAENVHDGVVFWVDLARA